MYRTFTVPVHHSENMWLRPPRYLNGIRNPCVGTRCRYLEGPILIKSFHCFGPCQIQISTYRFFFSTVFSYRYRTVLYSLVQLGGFTWFVWLNLPLLLFAKIIFVNIFLLTTGTLHSPRWYQCRVPCSFKLDVTEAEKNIWHSETLRSGSGMNIPDHISESLDTNFWVKNT